MIMEQSPFSPKCYSFKHNGPGLRYELALSTLSGHIVWVHGPYPCGSYSDLTILRLRLKGILDGDEQVIADKGYEDDKCVYFSEDMAYPDHLFSACRARHENMNRRIKQFNVAGQRFRHCISLHSICFHAVANISQLMIEYESPLYEI